MFHRWLLQLLSDADRSTKHALIRWLRQHTILSDRKGGD